MSKSFTSGKRPSSVNNQVEQERPKGKRPDAVLKFLDTTQAEGERPGKYVELGAIAYANHNQETGEIDSYSLLIKEGFTIEPGMKVKLFMNRPRNYQE